MQTVSVSVAVSKEAYELGQGLVKFASALKGALANGFQPGQDIPVVVAAAITELIPAMDGVQLLSDEVKQDPVAFASAFALSAKDLVKVFVP